MMSVIDEVGEGMRVVDGTGKKVGVVEDIKLADPDAITTEGQRFGHPFPSFRDVFEGGPDLPHEVAESLLRVGYIKVDGTGLHEDQFVEADRIDRVDGDTVYLKSEPEDSA